MLRQFRANMGANSSGLTLKDALCNDRYRKATWVNLGYIVFHELTGVNVIALYSNQMFKQMQTPSFKITPREGTYLVGVVATLSTLVSVFIVKFFGRVTLVVWGHAGIAIVHICIALCDKYHNSIGVLIFILLFSPIY